jgi:hypothetical protein
MGAQLNSPDDATFYSYEQDSGLASLLYRRDRNCRPSGIPLLEMELRPCAPRAALSNLEVTLDFALGI